MIVGAGAIGMEFAYVLANYGVQVAIVEYLDPVLPQRGQRRLQGDRQAVPKVGHYAPRRAQNHLVERNG
ncbi:MAG: NAD-binding protein [Lawsonella clevelandensis]